jgi:hypothetical protein
MVPSRREAGPVPPTDPNGRCETSNVALSGISSRIRTSIGPVKEARHAVEPDISAFTYRDPRDNRQFLPCDQHVPKPNRADPSARASWPSCIWTGRMSVDVRPSDRRPAILSVTCRLMSANIG